MPKVMVAPGLIFTLAILVLCSCSENTENKPAWEITEVISVQEQARDEVLASALNFTIPEQDQHNAWQRVMLYFNQVKSNFPGGPDRLPSITLNSNRSILTTDTQNYRYQVISKAGHKGDEYSISCTVKTPSAKQFLADQNAHNLARFIQVGHLELDLISP